MKSIFKGIFIVSVALSFTLSTTAQTAGNNNYSYVNPEEQAPTPTNNNFLSFGFGVGGYYPYSGPIYTSGPSLSLYFDNTTFKHIGPGYITLGGLFSYKQIATGYTNYNAIYNYYQSWSYYIIGARTAYHIFPFNSKFIDIYGGGMIGYYITGFKFTSNDPYYSEVTDPGNYLSVNHYPNFFACSVFAGVRSWFNNNGCIWADIGYGYTSINVGFSYRL